MKRVGLVAFLFGIAILFGAWLGGGKGGDGNVIFIVNPANGNFLANPANGNLIVK